MSICFLPKSRASMDHAPGPIMAKVAPSATSMMHTHGSAGWDVRMISSATAITIPAIGVHKPKSSRIPAPVAKACGMMVVSGAVARIFKSAERKRTAAVRSL